MLDSILAKLEGLIQDGKVTEAKVMIAEHYKDIPMPVIKIVDTKLFEMQLQKDVLIKQNSKPTKEHAIMLFHALFPTLPR